MTAVPQRAGGPAAPERPAAKIRAIHSPGSQAPRQRARRADGTPKRRTSILGRFNASFGHGWLLGGLLFLYLPIVALVLYSFNASAVNSVWGGFTLDWYRRLTHDRELLTALWLSLQIAFVSASASVLLGIFAAFSLVKYKRFTGRTLFAGMVNAPLVMPEVIVGLSLLLMMVSAQRVIGHPSRGFLTICLGHILVGMAYSTVVIRARLQELPAALEEAAMDLGARPVQVFFLVTLPMIGQALASAWLLTFSLSLDDVVASAFLSGPGTTTLPLVIFSRARLGVSPSVNAAATIIVGAVAVCVTAASLWLAHKERQRARDMSMAQRAD